MSDLPIVPGCLATFLQRDDPDDGKTVRVLGPTPRYAGLVPCDCGCYRPWMIRSLGSAFTTDFRIEGSSFDTLQRKASDVIACECSLRRLPELPAEQSESEVTA